MQLHDWTKTRKIEIVLTYSDAPVVQKFHTQIARWKNY